MDLEAISECLVENIGEDQPEASENNLVSESSMRSADLECILTQKDSQPRDKSF